MDQDALNALEQQATTEEAAATEAEVLKPGETSPGAPPVVADPAEELFTALTIAVAMLGQVLPYLPAIYTEQVLRGIAGALSKVSEKYGWDTSGFFSKYAPEIMLLATVLPTLPALKRGHESWIAAREKAAQQDGQQTAAAEAGQGAPVANAA